MTSRNFALAAFVRKRIFVKYILATLVVGVAFNALTLVFYYEYRQAKQTGRVAAEIATVTLRVAWPAVNLIEAGDSSGARELMGIFSGFPYTICADLNLEGEKVRPIT